MSKENNSNTTTPGSIQVPFDPTQEVSITNVLKNLQLEEFSLTNIGRLPCARNALLYGISSGLAVSAARFLARRNLRSAGNWGILAFAGMSVASWEMCRLQRRLVQEQLSHLAVEQAELQKQQQENK
ncbi:hypothetical protein BDR26DRAFT_939281 [Obelidium mucronatum]|nr:hypothetical protein BDR26DRAFT_939281 [Obelidium mucronatum]